MRQSSSGRINPGLKLLVKTTNNALAFAPRIEGAAFSPAVTRETECVSEYRKKPLHAVIVVENMTVPPDRRVWQQARALRDEGWRVSIITPQLGSYKKPYEVLEGIEIHRHPLLIEARTVAAYAVEYAGALLFELLQLIKLDLKDIDVLQSATRLTFFLRQPLLQSV